MCPCSCLVIASSFSILFSRLKATLHFVMLQAHSIVKTFREVPLRSIPDTTLNKVGKERPALPKRTDLLALFGSPHERRLQVNLFLQELAQAPVGITVAGFFMITKESVVTVCVQK